MNDRNGTARLLHHWREALAGDRLAHLIRDIARMQMRALQKRLAEEVSAISMKGVPPRTLGTVRKALLGMIENLAAPAPGRVIVGKQPARGPEKKLNPPCSPHQISG